MMRIDVFIDELLDNYLNEDAAIPSIIEDMPTEQFIKREFNKAYPDIEHIITVVDIECSPAYDVKVISIAYIQNGKLDQMSILCENY